MERQNRRLRQREHFSAETLEVFFEELEKALLAVGEPGLKPEPTDMNISDTDRKKVLLERKKLMITFYEKMAPSKQKRVRKTVMNGMKEKERRKQKLLRLYRNCYSMTLYNTDIGMEVGQ